MKNTVLIMIFGIFLFGCQRLNTRNKSTDFAKILEDNSGSSEITISEESMNKIIQSLP